jgi:hypothetical protein
VMSEPLLAVSDVAQMKPYFTKAFAGYTSKSV